MALQKTYTTNSKVTIRNAYHRIHNVSNNRGQAIITVYIYKDSKTAGDGTSEVEIKTYLCVDTIDKPILTNWTDYLSPRS